MRKAVILVVALPLLSGGCVTKMAYDLVTLPVKVGAKAVDVATVSSKERDEHYAHAQRKAEERQKKAEKEARKRDRKRDRDQDDYS